MLAVPGAAAAFACGSIGNVGPGFDVLGLAVEGLGDRVAVALVDGPSRVEAVSGRDAELVPREPERNCAALAAEAYLRGRGLPHGVAVTVGKGLPLSGGLGGSAASSVAGAYAAHLAAGGEPLPELAAGRPSALHLEIVAAALAGESAVAGAHLDNIAPAVFGGLALARCVAPIDVVPLRLAPGWWVALATPRVRVETRAARGLLPAALPREEWVRQMANTAALVHAFATGDAALLARALDDRHAEPRRSPLIPRFAAVKAAALAAGACGCSISGSGPTVFALAADEATARRCADAMVAAFADVGADAHVGPVAQRGVRQA